MNLTIIIPAYNEEAYLPPTLDAIHASVAHLQTDTDVDVEIIVVDNNSVDGTAEVARKLWSDRDRGSVCREFRVPETRVRGSPHGDVLVFVDADVIMPRRTLFEIYSVMSDPACVGGGVDVDYRPKRRAMRLYLGNWRALGRLTDMVQGATQFCRKSVFEEIGGYDETAWIGDDVDFYWALKRYANSGTVREKK